ncbi:MAG: uroporphyrinogen decarboxylase [Alphaproteobacteria bacterium]|nr:uroporphyrinogen decarboxylase [Alphaproteobacteria bacterium]HRW28841.1 uroporphyrinogen decarboxylase [Emcibacteraceae bacterium]
MSKNKLFIQTLKGIPSERVPFWFMRQAGRYLPEYMKLRKEAGSFLDLCYNPEFATEVTLQPLRRFNMDAAILFSDILVVPHALGQDLAFKTGEGPVLTPVDNLEKFKALSMEGFHEHLSPVYETVSNLSKKLPDHVALIGFAGAPWTVATYMVNGKGSKDQAETRLMAYQDRATFEKLIDLLVQSTSEYLIRQADHGAEALQIFDSWSGTLPADEFIKWCIEPMQKIVQNIRAVHPEIPIIGFPKGAGAKIRNYVNKTKVDGVSIDTSTSTSWVRNVIQPLCAVQGNLDPLLLVSGGAALEKAVYHILDHLKEGPHIFNLGHGIVPQTPPENVKLVSDIILNYRR